MSDTMDDLLDCRERLRKVEDELREARNTNALPWDIVRNFLTADEADDPDEPKPTLAMLVQRCFDWGDGAWYQAGVQMEARLAAESRIEKAHSVLRIAYDALGYAFLPEKKESIVTARSLIRTHLSAALSSEDATRPTGDKE